jgi:hypothetical protein
MTLNAELSTGRAALGEGSRDAVAATDDYRIPIFERLLWTLVVPGAIAGTQRRTGTRRRLQRKRACGSCLWIVLADRACLRIVNDGHDNGRQWRPLRSKRTARGPPGGGAGDYLP